MNTRLERVPLQRAALATGAAAGLLMWRGWRAHCRPPEVPHGFRAAPLARIGADAIPIIGVVSRLHNVVTRPVEMVHDAARVHGSVFTLRVPTRFDLTYLTDRAAYDQVLALPAEHAMMGPVFGNVPTVGFWFPRRHSDHDSLQDLALTGKRIMAGLLAPHRVTTLAPLTETVMAAHIDSWGPTVDMAEAFPRAIYEISGRYFAGDEFWDRYGARVTPLMRAIADGIEVPRATLAVTPARWFMREYRATKRLAAILREAAETMPDCLLFRSIRAAGVATGDAAWMAMYVLWNAVTYPGSYGLWTLLDVVSRPQVYRAATSADDPVTYLSWCLWETIRLNPVSSLVRALSKPFTYEQDGVAYHLPAGTIVGVAPSLLNQDPNVWDHPGHYRPERFADLNNPRRALFGSGPFGCVAGEFSRQLVAEVCAQILRSAEIRLLDGLPNRQCRVHLAYPDRPIPVARMPIGA
ncbi:cytochrome P450 [Nocardia cyriacigeorgica]|uniref:cytochrome P450 n=1 Tax=Nocardia cyriacigeorgica TaxID=135487 RepID=UPI002453E832|nr:cytochrome P450 [Nocardia cyriacigeorgica]